MPQHHLHRAQICPMIEQVGRKSVAQRVWRNVAIDSRAKRVAFNGIPEVLPGHGPAAPTGKQGGGSVAPRQSRARLVQVAPQPLHRLLSDGYKTLFTALAGHPHHTLAQIYRRAGKPHQFRDAQTRGIQQFQHGAVPQANGILYIRRRQQGEHFLFTHGIWQRTAPFRVRHMGAGVLGDTPFGQRVPVETLDRRYPPRAGTGAIAGLITLREAGQQIFLGGIEQVTLQPAFQVLQIAPVGGQRIAAQPTLQPHLVQITINRA